ncbi:MAG: AMP-binding protein [Micromonosporaceae bacterium]
MSGRHPVAGVLVVTATWPLATDELTAGEARAYRTLPPGPRRRSWLTARRALRSALAACRLPGDTSRHRMPSRVVSLSHSAEYAVAAVLIGAGPPVLGVGVDLELDRAPGPRTIPFFLTDAEREWTASLPATEQPAELLRLWTVKEALFKADPGSTSAPRGVMITHRAMLANQQTLREHMEIGPGTTIVSWLPTYHDMGLCLALLQPVYAGAQAVVMQPETFVMRPERWLRAISGLPDAMSASPDFGYAWCTRRVREDATAGLDLRGWRVAVNGAEPVQPDTLRAFHAAFARCGLREQTLTPAYGLAEATLFVTGGTGAAAPIVRWFGREALGGGGGYVELVGCGVPGPGIEVAVVDPVTRHRLADRTTGEIWVRSPGNGAGYWGMPEQSREVFAARLAGGETADDGAAGWLRTGDLGFLDERELFVTGRRKDLIVIHGANYYPQDFERLAQRAHPLFDGEFAAAYAAGDRVTVLVESADRNDRDGAAQAAAAAVRAVTAELPVTTDVVVVPRGQVPRTTSGKARRRECAQRLRDGALTVLAQWPRNGS